MENQVVPYIGMHGRFVFKSPLSREIPDIDFQVVSIRSLKELVDSEEEPLKTIYEPIGLSGTEYNQDLNENMKIVVLTDRTNSNYTYVPLNRIISLPDYSGVKYADKAIVVGMGKVPLDMDLTNITEILKDEILARTGLVVNPKELITSAIELVDDVKHETYERRIKYGGSKDDSWKVKYHKLLEEHEKLFAYNQKVNNGLIIKLEDGTIGT